MSEGVNHAVMRQHAVGERNVIAKVGKLIGHGSPLRCCAMVSGASAPQCKIFSWIFVTILAIGRQVVGNIRIDFRTPFLPHRNSSLHSWLMAEIMLI